MDFFERSGNPDRKNILIYSDNLIVSESIVISGAQALCRPAKEGVPLQRCSDNLTHCRKAVTENLKLMTLPLQRRSETLSHCRKAVTENPKLTSLPEEGGLLTSGKSGAINASRHPRHSLGIILYKNY